MTNHTPEDVRESEAGLRREAIQLICIEAEEMGYCEEDIADWRAGNFDGDDLLALQAVERALCAHPPAASPSAETVAEEGVAMVRVRHGGYSMELARYVAYALTDGDHWLYTRPSPAHDKTAPVGEVERDISGETVCGFRVAAYRETHPEHGDKYGHTYSEHWSTPNSRDPRVVVERLFTEAQLRAALETPAPEAETVASPAGERDEEQIGLQIAERIRQEMTSGRQWWLDALSADQRQEFESELTSTCVAIVEDELSPALASAARNMVGSDERIANLDLHALASAIHDARFDKGQDTSTWTPFEDERHSGKVYCLRIANAVQLHILAALQQPEHGERENE